MTNISKKDVFVALIIAISILLLTFGCVYVVRSQTAYADYDSDYLNNPQAIVNFNQISNWYTANNDFYNFTAYRSPIYNITLRNTSITWARMDIVVPNQQLDSTHKYYFKPYFDNAEQITFYSGTNGNVLTHLNNLQGYIITGYNNYQFSFDTYFANNPNSTIHCALTFVDLTQMYGLNSEPDLDECQRIFVVDYYNYTLGAAVAYSQMNAFAQGVDSVIQNLDTTIDSVTIVNTAQPYLGGYRDSNIQYYTNTGNYPETRYTDILVFKNACYIPFLSTLESGTTIVFNSGSILDRDLGEFRCSISVLGDNGQLSLFDTLQSDLSIMNYSYSYTLPFACNGIVIQNLDNADKFLEFIEPTIQYQSNNLGNIIANSYNSGYNTAKSYYDNYYGLNGTGYNDIYNSGYQRGLNIQLSEANRHFYTFPQFLGALFDVPVKTITALLDFEVLGFNLKNFFFSLITLSIVFAIIKFILVRTGDK